MENLFYFVLAGFVVIAALKTFIFWVMQILLHPKTPTSRGKVMDARANYTSKLFNELLKSKKLDYSSIDSISIILKKYADKNRKYNNKIHMIYSTLKKSIIKNQDLANIQLILDCARAKAK